MNTVKYHENEPFGNKFRKVLSVTWRQEQGLLFAVGVPLPPIKKKSKNKSPGVGNFTTFISFSPSTL
jgi:hypothetical protein